MKKFLLFPIAAALVLAVSCEKPLSEAEKNAQIEREVQARLAAERQTQEQQRLAQEQADLEARERALTDKEAAAAVTTPVPAATRYPAEPVAQPMAEPAVEESEETALASSDAAAPRSYDTFYEKLEPYGSWRETGDYGYVWQPREAQRSRDWRPYTNGRWAYTDAGWTWISNERCGWATYHYGRWTRLRGVGWVWVPGEEWAPAWVSWRTSDHHVGWAPLPPEARFERRTGIKKWADSYYGIEAGEYVFIPNEDIGAENLERSVIPAERNVTIVNETTNVTNISYVNTTIVNEGPNFEALRRGSRRPVERLRLNRDYNIGRDQAQQPEVRGNVLSISTPLFTAQVHQRPRNVGAPIPQATVDRDWDGRANQPEAQRAREKMKAEATPPPDAPSKKFEKPVATTSTPAPTAPATTPPPSATVAPPSASPSATPQREPRSGPGPSASPARPVPTATPAPTPRSVITPTPVTTPAPTPLSTPKFVPSATVPPRPPPAPSVAPAATIAPRPVTTPAATIPPPTKVLPPPNIRPLNPPNPVPTPPPNPRRGDEPVRERDDGRGAQGVRPIAPPTVPPRAPLPPRTVPTAPPVERIEEPKEATPNLKGAPPAVVVPPPAPIRSMAPPPPAVPPKATPPPAKKIKPGPPAPEADGETKPVPDGANEP